MDFAAALTTATKLTLSAMLVVTPVAQARGASTLGARTSENRQPSDESGAETEAPSQDDKAWAEAEALFRQGSAHFAASDYMSAIKEFTRALDIVNHHDFDPAVRRALLVNLARVHRRAFLIDDELTHLTMSADIYRRIASTAPGSEDAQEAMRELPLLEGQIANIRAQRRDRASSNTSNNLGQNAAPGTTETGEVPPPSVDIAAQGPEDTTPTATPATGRDQGNIKQLKVAAWSLGGVAVLGVGSIITGIAVGQAAVKEGERLVQEDPSRPVSDFESVISRGRAGNILAFTGAGVAAAALGSSLILALKARKQAKRLSAAHTPAKLRFSAGLRLDPRARNRSFTLTSRLRF